MSRRRKPVFKDPHCNLDRRGRRASERTELTDELVATATAGMTERTIHDTHVRGLFVRIRPTGAKTYSYRQPKIGNKHAVTLGSAETYSIASARAAARKIQIDRQEGRMSCFSSGGPSRWTVARAFEAYIGTQKKSAWTDRIERTFRNNILPKIGHMKLASLSFELAAAPFEKLEGAYSTGTPYYILSAFLTWAKFNGLTQFNVLRGRASLPRRPSPRTYPLSADEIGQFWRACDTLPRQWCYAFKLMIASGRPIHEVLSLSTSSAANWPQGTEMTHGRRGNVVAEILSELSEGRLGNIFIARGKANPMVFQQRHWNTLRRAAGHERATMNDIRRGLDRQFGICRGDLAIWDEFLRSCMVESFDDEAVVI